MRATENYIRAMKLARSRAHYLALAHVFNAIDSIAARLDSLHRAKLAIQAGRARMQERHARFGWGALVVEQREAGK